MTDDLVKRLRELGDHASFEPHMHHTAADRIEELEAKHQEAFQMYVDANEARIDAEAKLAQQDDLVQAAVAAERERCAKVAQRCADLADTNGDYLLICNVVAAIRKGEGK